MPRKRSKAAKRVFTDHELGHLLFKFIFTARRNDLRTYLKSLGGTGTLKELNDTLTAARRNPVANEIAARLLNEDARRAGAREINVSPYFAMLDEIHSQMERSGIRQAALAKSLGVSPPQVNDYMKARKIPGGDVLARIADALGKRWRLVDPVRRAG